MLNLSLFFLDGVSYERIILCGFNLFGHYLFMEQLYWIMPYNGEEAPDVGTKLKLSLTSEIIISSCSNFFPRLDVNHRLFDYNNCCDEANEHKSRATCSVDRNFHKFSG